MKRPDGVEEKPLTVKVHGLQPRVVTQGSPASGRDTPDSRSSAQSRSPYGRSGRRSSDVIRETKALDDEHKNRDAKHHIRETKSAQIRIDDIGGVAYVNEYAIIGELGKGSFAEVKLCKRSPNPLSPDDKEERSPSPSPSPSPSHKEEDEELFAIKIFSKSLLLRRRSFQRTNEGRVAVTTDLDKVQKEIAVMKKLVHPNLVRLFEVIDDTSQDALYLVMEFVPGGSIMDYNPEDRKYYYKRSRTGVMREVSAAKHICDVMAGLVYLHMHHICHRDLKPENVLVDSQGRCKIADFGVAHYFEEEEIKSPTESLSAIYRSNSRGLLKQTDGTWCFWAPEMCRAEPFSGYACDTWAVGVCLWIFVFGTLPFMEELPEELFDAIMTEEPKLPDKEISDDLKDLLDQLLKKRPSERVTLEDALDHPWMQLADESEDLGISASSMPQAAGKSLRARAYSFRRVHVTEEDVNGAIRTVNNFVLVSKLKKRLTQKLQEARASLQRARSPSTTVSGSGGSTTPGSSRFATPTSSHASTPRSVAGSPAAAGADRGRRCRTPGMSSRGTPSPDPLMGSIDDVPRMESPDLFGQPVAKPVAAAAGGRGTPTPGKGGRATPVTGGGGLRTKKKSCSVM